MLVLKLRRSEWVSIGPDVDVTYLGREGDSVILGIEAPPELNISRGQLSGNAEKFVVPTRPIADDSPAGVSLCQPVRMDPSG